MKGVIAGELALSGRATEGWLRVEGDRIAEVGTGRPPRRATVRHAGLVAPGLCDLQVNGAGGRNVYEGRSALDRVDAIQLAHGVTSYLPTLISTDPETAERAVADIAERAADPLSPVEGAHLEGPFLSRRHPGVHRTACLRVPRDGLPRYYSEPCVRLVTLAPELPGGLELVDWLRARRPRVAVSLGHSGASPETAGEAEARGARCVTHLFNAMSAVHHRKPGLAVWAMTDRRIRIGVIADGIHVAPAMLELVARAAGGRVVLVTDASPAAGARKGRYEMAGLTIERHSDGRVEAPDGGLAGSSLTLDQAVRNWVEWTGAPLAQAVRAASDRPAALVGLPSGLRAGRFADLVLMDRDGAVERVMRRGRWV